MKTDWPALLAHSYARSRDDCCPPETPRQFLAVHVFQFTTYDDAADELLGQKAIEVCEAITTNTTFKYACDENYLWYLTMVNMPFFGGRLTWGTSIRGAMWESPMPSFHTCGFYEGWNQITDPIEFKTRDEWLAFITAVVAFGSTP